MVRDARKIFITVVFRHFASCGGTHLECRGGKAREPVRRDGRCSVGPLLLEWCVGKCRDAPSVHAYLSKRGWKIYLRLLVTFIIIMHPEYYLSLHYDADILSFSMVLGCMRGLGPPYPRAGLGLPVHCGYARPWGSLGYASSFWHPLPCMPSGLRLGTPVHKHDNLGAISSLP